MININGIINRAPTLIPYTIHMPVHCRGTIYNPVRDLYPIQTAGSSVRGEQPRLEACAFSCPCQ
jgi:hypothetical protein